MQSAASYVVCIAVVGASPLRPPYRTHILVLGAVAQRAVPTPPPSL